MSLWVTEYADTAMVQTAGKAAPIAQAPALASQVLTITGASSQSAAFNAKTTLVRIHTDAIIAIEFGTNPTATIPAGGFGSARMVVGQTEYFGVPRGQSFKVAGITTT